MLEGLAILFFAALVVFDVIAHFDTPRHQLFERIGLVCFAIAVLMEIVAYPYGKRNDELSQVEIAALNKEAGVAQMESERLKTALHLATDESRREQTKLEEEQQETARAQESAARAQLQLKRYVDSVATVVGPRKLTAEQHKRLAEIAASNVGVPIDLYALPEPLVDTLIPRSQESLIFAEDIAEALAAMDVRVGFSMNCLTSRLVGVLAVGERPADWARLSGDRKAIQEILNVFELEHMEATPLILEEGGLDPCTRQSVPIDKERAGFPSQPTTRSEFKRTVKAKISIIVGAKPAAIFKPQ